MKPRPATTETLPVPSSQPVPRQRPGSLASASAAALETPPRGDAAPNGATPPETPEQAAAAIMVEGLGMNAVVAQAFSRQLGAVNLEESYVALALTAKAAANGDRTSQEALLAAQVVSLNTIYTECALMAHGQLPTNLDLFERLMRIGLKAQSQSRATAESLALMQNPPSVFAKQANIAHGPQQVNNGVTPPSSVTRAEQLISQPIELLEAAYGERMDRGETHSAGSCDQDMAPVGTIHRPPQLRRKATVVTQR